MSKLWSIIIVFAIIYGIVTSRVDELSKTLLNLPKEGFDFTVILVTSSCFWSGFMWIMQEVGIIKFMGKLMNPLLKVLFPKLKDKLALDYISTNLAANLFGMGFAATPSGMKGIKRLQEISQLPKNVASDEMITFLVINTAGITIMPTTIIAVRQANSAVNPSDFFIFGLLASIVTATIGLFLERLLRKPYGS